MNEKVVMTVKIPNELYVKLKLKSIQDGKRISKEIEKKLIDWMHSNNGLNRKYKKEKLFSITVDEELRKQVKIAAVKLETTVSDIISYIIDEYTKDFDIEKAVAEASKQEA